MEAAHTSVLISKSGEPISDETEKANAFEQTREHFNAFADVYKEISSDSNLSKEFLVQRRKFEELNKKLIEDKSQSNSDLNYFFSQELADALESAKDSSPGMDWITVSMLRHLSHAAKTVLLKLISLLGKIGTTSRLETLAVSIWYLERNCLFAEEQSGFRAKGKTLDNIIRLEHCIQEANM